MSIRYDFDLESIAFGSVITFRSFQDAFLEETVAISGIAWCLLSIDTDIERFSCSRVCVGFRVRLWANDLLAEGKGQKI